MIPLDRVFPFLSVLSLYLFFLIDGMVTDPAKRWLWLGIIALFILSDVIYRIISYGIRSEDQNRYIGTGLGLSSFFLSLLRDYLDISNVAGINAEASAIPKVREFLLLLVVIFAFSFLLQVVLLEVGRASLEAQSNLSKSKSSLLQNALLGFLLLLPVLVAINYFAIKRNYNFDLSAKGKYSLSQTARTLLKQIKKETSITAFYPRPLEADGPSNSFTLTRIRPDVEIILDQIRAENAMISTQFINADVETDLLKDFPQAANGSIVIRAKKESVVGDIPFAEEKIFVKDVADLEEMERKLISALFTVATEQKKVYFTTSNGERFGVGFKSLPNEQINRFTSNLQFLNFKAGEWGFAQGWPSAFPTDADMVAIIGATVPFSEEARAEIKKYVLEKNGKLFVTIDPRGREDFSWLLSASGLEMKNEALVEVSEKPGVIVAKRMPDHKITELIPKKDLGVLFPYSGYFVTVSAGTNPFLFKSENILETGFDVYADLNKNSKLDADEKKENRILSAILTPLSLTGDKTGRVVIHAGTSWITDQFISYTINVAYSNSLVTGLFLDEAISEIPKKKEEATTVNLSDSQKLIVWAIGVFLYPGFIFGLGAYYVSSRRKKASIEV
ncbi:Gldg family protein [Leptospira ognonensis]|nr:Gldg family protein [Leptospira ognonensis]